MEMLASAYLGNIPMVKVFYPQTAHVKKTNEGKITLRKPLFPGYIFSSFDPSINMRTVNYCQGVSYIVRHGLDPVEVPGVVIEELESLTDCGVISVSSSKPELGQPVRVLHGLFEGQEGKVVKLIPAKQRIQVLLEILGAVSTVEVDEDFVDAGETHPLTDFHPNVA